MWLLVVNRYSGRGKYRKKLSEFVDLCESNSINYEVIDEDSAGKTDQILKLKITSEKVDAVIAFGGDGLVSLCIQSLAKTDIGFSVVPTGTGNDFARTIGTAKKSVFEIFHSIFEAKPIRMDVALATNQKSSRYFIQVLSVGFDAFVNEFANNMKWPKGKIKYTLAMLKLLPKAQNIDFIIESDDHELAIKSMLIAVANGSTYGGGMRILPNASYDDGLLDLLYVDPVSKFTLLSIFPKVFRGSHVKHRAVHVLTSKSFDLRGETKSYADGEFIGDLPLKISVVPAGLKTWICK